MPKDDAIQISTVGFTVSDMARSLDFYTRILPFQKVSDREFSGAAVEQLTGLKQVVLRVVQLRLGDETLELMAYSSSGQPAPADTQSNDRWFQHVAIVVSDMAKAYAHLQQHQVSRVSTEPQTLPEWNKDMAGIQAFYFHDPDGHFLELIQFPPDKGADRWHQGNNGLFLGIDHTAIVVADTDTSLQFYQETLGLSLAQTMQNHGEEHARLSQVPGIHIKITRLDPDQGIGLELLEYLAPRSGRPIPDDIRPQDLMHGQIAMLVPDPIALAKQHLARPVSIDLGAASTEPVHRDLGMLVRDPDGHAVCLIEEA